MILKELRISRHLSQEQLAQMSGLNIRTIQRIESGRNASIESLKCLASALEVEISTLNQENFKMDKSSENWKRLPFLLKFWFVINFLQTRPSRHLAIRLEVLSHITGYLFCCLGLINEASLAGGIIMLSIAYLLHLLKWQGDKYGIWYDVSPDKVG